MVGMIAKHVFGCTVIGSAGGPEKCKLVTERFGFDHCIDYKASRGASEKDCHGCPHLRGCLLGLLVLAAANIRFVTHRPASRPGT